MQNNKTCANQPEPGREPPAHVKRVLRREVNYGCPVPGCGEPFLEWHHFDPTWSEEKHHRPEGMIALCTQHHPQADAGTFEIETLKGFKANPNPLEVVTAKFNWMPSRCLIRLGGCYSFNCFRIPNPFLPIPTNEPLLVIDRNEMGLVTLSFKLKTSDDTLLAAMYENFLEVSKDAIHDLSISASGNRIKIWLAERDVGFEFHFSRKSFEEIQKNVWDEEIKILHEISPDVEPKDSWLTSKNRWNDQLRQQLLGMFEKDEVSSFAQSQWLPITSMLVFRFAMQFPEKEGVPVFDLVSCKLNHNGKSITMRDGILTSPWMRAGMCTFTIS